ncbi:MAG TPA: hypothetical protein VFK05_20275 [Polyangiaceae bacterium]|nr:hypothetical protein [Polyangiaceae bacterium]
MPRSNGESGRTTGGTGGSSADSGAIGSEAGEGGTDAIAGAAGSDASGGAAGSDASGGAAGSDASGEAGMAGSDEVSTCAGCRIASVCVGTGSTNPANPCEICDVTRSRAAYSPSTGASCGSSANTECSAPDTCDEHAVCQANDVASGLHCTGGACQAGVCKPNPFDCIAPTPPVAALPAQVYLAIGSVPVASGGVIVDGRYTPKRVDLYSSSTTGIDVRTFEFKGGFVQAALRYFNVSNGAAYIPEVQFSGTFTGSGSLLKFDLQRCDPNYDLSIPNLAYTATANGLVTIETLQDGAVIVTSYLRE